MALFLPVLVISITADHILNVELESRCGHDALIVDRNVHDKMADGKTARIYEVSTDLKVTADACLKTGKETLP